MFQITEVKNTKERKQFVDFQFQLYRNEKYWVPPIKADEVKQLDFEQNPAFENTKGRFWLLSKNGKTAGRVGALINHEYNAKTGKSYGRITRMEFIDDKEVSKQLFKTAIEWLNAEGMEFVHGPLGFSNVDNQGLLIEGFDHLPSIASVYHMSYYKEHFDAFGFEKENDWIEFRLTVGEQATNKGIRGGELIKKRYGFEVIEFNKTKELMPYLHPVFELLNKAFDDLPYVTKFSKKMVETIGAKYFKVLNPRFVRVIEKGDELVAFIVAMPSLSVAMQKANGKLFPFGFYHVLKALKKPQVIDLLLTGVEPHYQSAGAAVILLGEIQKEMREFGIDQMETTGIFETNHNVISNWKNYPHIQHKRRRCFVKKI